MRPVLPAFRTSIARLRPVLLGAAAGLACALAGASVQAAEAIPPHATVALTFDDLPGLVLRPDQAYIDKTNRKLLHRLRMHHFEAIGFVNEGKLTEGKPEEGQPREGRRERQVRNLELWLKAGYDLGNHTYSHSSPNQIGLEAYLADIERGEHVIRPMMEAAHRRLQWFRHPYLETGSPKDVRDRIDTFLAHHGYRVAPVTIDCDDWEFADSYDDAVMRGDKAEARRVRETYLAYTERTIGWYRQASRALFGRDIAYVMLLHDTRLNADSLDGLAAILARQNMTTVSLDTAMRDPAYATPDDYAGKDGIEWMERWSETIKKDLPWDAFEDVPKAIVESYQKLDGK